MAPTTTAGGDYENGTFPYLPGKSVTFNDGDGRFGGTDTYLQSDSKACEGFSHDNSPAFDALSAAASFSQTADNQSDGGSGPRSSTVFARLWAECIGDETCAAFASDASSNLRGTDGQTRTHSGGHETKPPREQHPPSQSLLNHRHLGPWERLVAVLMNERGVDVSRALTAHEQILLEREVADWLQLVQGRKGREQGPGKGMAERLASAAAAALHQEEAVPPAACERPAGSRTNHPAGNAAASEENRSNGGIPNVGRRKLSVVGLEFPAVVVEGSPSPAEGRPEKSTERAGDGGPSATAAGEAGEGMGTGTATSGSNNTPERQLDLRGVALDAHEVCAVVSEVALLPRSASVASLLGLSAFP